VTSLVGIGLWIGAAVYYKLQERKAAPFWTLWSWSCQHKDWTNGKMSFSTMCTRMVSQTEQRVLVHGFPPQK
jgi:hypothetical protein